MRRTKRYPVLGSNALWQMYRTVPFWKVFKNVFVNLLARYCPSLRLKNTMYRRLLHMEVGDKTAIALMVMMDAFFPELIRIGTNTTIGYNTTILTHEYLLREYRLGAVEIGSHVMIGANCTILPGVKIGDYAVVGAGSVVTKDVEPYTFVAGNPAKFVRRVEDISEIQL